MSNLTSTMHAWRMRLGHDEPIIRDRIPIPKPAANEVLVKMLAMGVCHSDSTIRDLKDFPGWRRVFTLGHEGAGEVVELGSGVDPSELQIGDRVAIQIIPGCLQCEMCTTGHAETCQQEDNGGYGLGRDGVFGEYLAVRSDAAVKVPLGVSSEAAAIAADAVLTAYNAVKYTAAVKPHQTIVIFGMGGLGLNALQVAQHLGVKRILVSDKKQEALDLAIKYGVPSEDAICTGGPNARAVHEVIAERGLVVDTVIDFVGHEQTFSSAQLAVRPAGLVVLVGLLSPNPPIVSLVTVPKKLTIKASWSGPIAALRECVDLLAKGAIKPTIQTGSINDIPQVLRELDEGQFQGRKVLLPDWK